MQVRSTGRSHSAQGSTVTRFRLLPPSAATSPASILRPPNLAVTSIPRCPPALAALTRQRRPPTTEPRLLRSTWQMETSPRARAAATRPLASPTQLGACRRRLWTWLNPPIRSSTPSSRCLSASRRPTQVSLASSASELHGDIVLLPAALSRNSLTLGCLIQFHRMAACVILLWKAEGFWDVCAFTGRNVFHSLALHPHRGRSARAMALLLAQPDVYRAAATALDKQGFPPFFTAISCENMDCANAMIDSSLVTSG